MDSFFGRVKMWVYVFIAVALFIPAYYSFDKVDVADVLSGAAIVAAVAMVFTYLKGFGKTMLEPTSEMTVNGSLWLIGIILIGTQSAFSKAFALWFRTYGHSNPDIYLNFVPALASYLAFLGYLIQGGTAKEKWNWKRVVITGISGVVLGSIFVVLHHAM